MGTLLHGREVADRVKAIGKRFIFQLMENVQLTGSKVYGTYMVMYYVASTADVSLAQEFH